MNIVELNKEEIYSVAGGSVFGGFLFGTVLFSIGYSLYREATMNEAEKSDSEVEILRIVYDTGKQAAGHFLEVSLPKKAIKNKSTEIVIKNTLLFMGTMLVFGILDAAIGF